MQTFLPYSDFTKTARALDDRRLFKQLVEANQIIAIITHGKTKSGKPYKAWTNHPAVKMWRGYDKALKEYANEILKEIRNRNKINTSAKLYRPKNIIYPTWLGNKKFHSAHRSALLKKNKKHYAQFNWLEKPNINYIWPK